MVCFFLLSIAQNYPPTPSKW
uniref:Uncharacterized protein n=1 Tax=Arundo donax TaxID=35708 RepID=A0A0A8Y9X1_ARUDO